ncbi:MAG TPA: hypothetical protein VFE11_02995 [Dongiaceae bacterium]|nr:hypothetical protein [Dongiaceae bacterium]
MLEIVYVLASVVAALAALALPWLLVALITLPVLMILSLQLALFVALVVRLSLLRVRGGLLKPLG